MVNQYKDSPFYLKLQEQIAALGGMFNAHLHLDRAGTFDEKYFQDGSHVIDDFSISLHSKHSLINNIHRGLAYTENDLKQRVNFYLDVMISCNTIRADTLVDVTNDNVQLSALNILKEIKLARSNEIDLRIGAYSPLGFKDSESSRWDIYKQGAELANFIGALPEADDQYEYPDHIGFMEHCRRTLELAQEIGKEIHVHTDQCNIPEENGTEQLIEAVKNYGSPSSNIDDPMVWAIHMISPSTYDEPRFNKLVEGLLDNNIGVICCPSAALGMRQIRSIHTPSYNSIPRILELLANGVHVRIASDNIADICSPSTTANLIDEVFILSAAIRFYHVEILAKLACGKRLNENERLLIKEHLANNQKEIDKVYNESVEKFN